MKQPKRRADGRCGLCRLCNRKRIVSGNRVQSSCSPTVLRQHRSWNLGMFISCRRGFFYCQATPYRTRPKVVIQGDALGSTRFRYCYIVAGRETGMIRSTIDDGDVGWDVFGGVPGLWRVFQLGQEMSVPMVALDIRCETLLLGR